MSDFEIGVMIGSEAVRVAKECEFSCEIESTKTGVGIRYGTVTHKIDIYIDLFSTRSAHDPLGFVSNVIECAAKKLVNANT